MAPSKKTTRNKRNNFKNHKNRETKLTLVFDPKKRKEFLTGFRKRKLQRQQAAKEQLQQQLKLEQKRLRTEAKENFNKLVVSHKRIPELDDFLAKHEEQQQQQYDDVGQNGDDVTVKVVELNPNEIAIENNWIGDNTSKNLNIDHYQTVKKEEDEEIENDCNGDEIVVKGMELKDELQKQQRQQQEQQQKEAFKSKRDIKKLLKKKATQKVKQSKVFQKKNQYERRKQLKKNRVLKRKQEKQEKQNKRTKKRRK